MNSSPVTFIEAPFIATHRAASGGDIQILGIGSPFSKPDARQVIFWNREKELFLVPLEQFVQSLPDGRRRYYPLNDALELLTMVTVPPMKGDKRPGVVPF